VSDSGVCVECGNDDAAYGYDRCTDCLMGEIPDDWYVLWCEECLTSLMWALADGDTYQIGEWGDAVVWAINQAHPAEHPRLSP
jgi:hypothetical protein